MATSISLKRSLEILGPAQPHNFLEPVKKIHDGPGVSSFLTSRAYRDIITFLMQLNHAMFPRFAQGTSSSQENIQTFDVSAAVLPFSDTVTSLQGLLNALDKIIDEVPLDTGPRRFGNVSFRKWSELVEERAGLLLEEYLPAQVRSFKHGSDVDATHELRAYLLGSFGSAQRLDYGTGHELSFLAFLGGIWKLGGFAKSASEGEERGIVLGVINPYLALIRRLILTYTLEPAGSHGVWGLDDHSFLPYVLGSAQYGPAIEEDDQVPIEGSRLGAPDPGNVASAALVERERNNNMYFGAVGFIYDVKTGPFWEHSPTLYDISGVKAGWGKINKGMMKMYNAEVLSKLPVVQHFPFGSLFSWERDPDAPPSPAPTMHTSSLPVKKESDSVSIGSASMRSMLQESTKVPWATAGTNQPDQGAGTEAPWASGRTPMSIPGSLRSVNHGPTSTPVPATASARRGAATRTPRIPNAAPGSSIMRPSGETVENKVEGSMPPPTRAPWAK